MVSKKYEDNRIVYREIYPPGLVVEFLFLTELQSLVQDLALHLKTFWPDEMLNTVADALFTTQFGNPLSIVVVHVCSQ